MKIKFPLPTSQHKLEMIYGRVERRLHQIVEEVFLFKYSLRNQISRGILIIYLDLTMFPQRLEFVRALHRLLEHNEMLKHFNFFIPQPPHPLGLDSECQLAK